MALFKILKGESSRISTETTPFQDGCAYFTQDDGGFYIDSEDNGNQRRIRINPPQRSCASIITLNLLASAWSGQEAPYTQELAVGKLGENSDGIVAISQTAMTDQRMAARSAMLHVIGQSTGKLVIAADGVLPETDIPIDLMLFDV